MKITRFFLCNLSTSCNKSVKLTICNKSVVFSGCVHSQKRHRLVASCQFYRLVATCWQIATSLLISSSCNKLVKIRLVATRHWQTCCNLLKQLVTSLWITRRLASSLLTICNSLVVNRLNCCNLWHFLVVHVGQFQQYYIPAILHTKTSNKIYVSSEKTKTQTIVFQFIYIYILDQMQKCVIAQLLIWCQHLKYRDSLDRLSEAFRSIAVENEIWIYNNLINSAQPPPTCKYIAFGIASKSPKTDLRNNQNMHGCSRHITLAYIQKLV